MSAVAEMPHFPIQKDRQICTPKCVMWGYVITPAKRHIEVDTTVYFIDRQTHLLHFYLRFGNLFFLCPDTQARR